MLLSHHCQCSPVWQGLELSLLAQWLNLCPSESQKETRLAHTLSSFQEHLTGLLQVTVTSSLLCRALRAVLCPVLQLRLGCFRPHGLVWTLSPVSVSSPVFYSSQAYSTRLSPSHLTNCFSFQIFVFSSPCSVPCSCCEWHLLHIIALICLALGNFTLVL